MRKLLKEFSTTGIKLLINMKFPKTLDPRYNKLRGEEFKDIPGWEDYYEISCFGRVFRKNRAETFYDVLGRLQTRVYNRRLLKSRTNKIEQFYFVELSATAYNTVNGKIIGREKTRKTFYLHKLVGQLWLKSPTVFGIRKRKAVGIGRPYNMKKGIDQIYVEIINGKYDDIRPDNLRWESWRSMYRKQVKNGRYIEMELYKRSPLYQKAIS